MIDNDLLALTMCQKCGRSIGVLCTIDDEVLCVECLTAAYAEVRSQNAVLAFLARNSEDLLRSLEAFDYSVGGHEIRDVMAQLRAAIAKVQHD